MDDSFVEVDAPEAPSKDDDLVEVDVSLSKEVPFKDGSLVEVDVPEAPSNDEYFVEEDAPPIEGTPSKGKHDGRRP